MNLATVKPEFSTTSFFFGDRHEDPRVCIFISEITNLIDLTYWLAHAAVAVTIFGRVFIANLLTGCCAKPPHKNTAATSTDVQQAEPDHVFRSKSSIYWRGYLYCGDAGFRCISTVTILHGS
jgi:hypothetical protein